MAIDLKSYYASVECADRHLDTLTTNLVVADTSRTSKTICLAVSPALKAYGIGGRCRLFELEAKVREINGRRLSYAKSRHLVRDQFRASSYNAEDLAADPTLELNYLTAPPRMHRYMEVSAQIYEIYLQYVAPCDIFPYSVDEVFIDATGYLDYYQMNAREFASTLIKAVLHQTGITATCGIGTNLYLAKVAMDILAKHVPADEDGVRIAELDEQSFRLKLWDHTPLTDFWRCGPGIAARLNKLNIKTMGDLARASYHDPEYLYKVFGIDAEILIDHAWGLEPVTMKEINNYTSDSNSLSEGQVLSEPYSYEKARLVVQEMTDSLMLQLADKNLVTASLTLQIGYDTASVRGYRGQIVQDHYGRSVPKPAHGTAPLGSPTNLGSQLQKAILTLYQKIADPDLLVRRITITANRVEQDTGYVQTDFFTDPEQLEREKQLQDAMISIKKRHGKNGILKGSSYLEGATMRQRNQQIGGHRSGEEDTP